MFFIDEYHQAFDFSDKTEHPVKSTTGDMKGTMLRTLAVDSAVLPDGWNEPSGGNTIVHQYVALLPFGTGWLNFEGLFSGGAIPFRAAIYNLSWDGTDYAVHQSVFSPTAGEGVVSTPFVEYDATFLTWILVNRSVDYDFDVRFTFTYMDW